MSKPIVVVTDLSNRIIYYQWFVYGFMLLDKSGIIKLKFDLPLSQKLYVINHAQFFVRCLNKIKNYFQGNKEIKKYCSLVGIEVTFEGNGYVTGQSIPEGTIINKDTKLTDAKKLTSIITEQISKEQKEFYDIQVFLDIDGEEIDGYPTIGYLGKNAKDFKYTTASYEKDEE